ncbi:MAG: shikimate dehydrogenase, partial [Pseudomonadota bacterium]|nr:shikimate dehydrogenase [Pseudomonadota bacterium]
DMVINATPLGLHDNDEIPLDVNLLRIDCLVCDIIMIPERTRLITAAQRSGRPVHVGRYMLDYQVDLIGEFIGAYEKNSG